MIGKLGTGSKERIPGSILLVIGPLETGTNCLQKRYGLSLVNLKFLETELESSYKRGEVKGIEVWRKSSKSAVK